LEGGATGQQREGCGHKVQLQAGKKKTRGRELLVINTRHGGLEKNTEDSTAHIVLERYSTQENSHPLFVEEMKKRLQNTHTGTWDIGVKEKKGQKDAGNRGKACTSTCQNE